MTPYESGATEMQRLAAQLVLDKQGALGSVSLAEAIASISLTAAPASGEGADAIEALDKALAGKAAELANKRFGQWMPERWLYLFVEEYNKLRATK